MPIRFRCAYCNQLMGIARRKAGMVVRCPTCSGQVVVPDPGTAGEAGPSSGPPRPADAGAPLFEGSDFDQIFEAPAPKEQHAATVGNSPSEEKAAGWVPQAAGNRDLGRLDSGGPVPLPLPAPPPGILLSPTLVTLLMVFGILLLALVFGAGILVGKYAFGS